MLVSLLLFHVSEEKRKTVVGAEEDSTVTKKQNPFHLFPNQLLQNHLNLQKF